MSAPPASLKQVLLADLAVGRSLTVEGFMARCLTDPLFGYYTTRSGIGRGGDFITAPEISQMVGELLGAFVVDLWERGDRPAPFTLLELGPGNGTLMADLLRVADHVPGFAAARQVVLVDPSPTLRRRQAQRLAAHPGLVWYDTLEAVPDNGPTLLIANEVLDALPVRQLIRAEDGTWRERMVVANETGDGLAFGVGAAEAGPVPEALRRQPPGTVIELAPARAALLAEVAFRLAATGGAALWLDYGYLGPLPGDSLQALAEHRPVDPLEAPGAADLTAHVDFGAAASLAAAADMRVAGLMTQRAFLTGLGIHARAERLAARRPDERPALARAVDRLTGDHAMGTIFKALAFDHAGAAQAWPQPWPAPWPQQAAASRHDAARHDASREADRPA